MQELTIKGQEIIKINGKRIAIQAGNIYSDTMFVKPLTEEDENNICRVYLEQAYVKQMKLNPIMVKQDEGGRSYFAIYNQDNEEVDGNRFYLSNCKIITEPALYGIEEEADKTYVIYVDKINVKIIIIDNKSSFITVKDIREDILDGKINFNDKIQDKGENK